MNKLLNLNVYLIANKVGEIMRTITLTEPHSLHQKELPETVTAIGFFDGVHKGHKQVIETAVNIAKDKKMESAVITFHPHPSVVLSKGKKQVEYITQIEEKEKILQELNVDRLYIIKFNVELASLSPQEFIDEYIIGLNIRHVVAGFDFTYGHKGKGNMTTMANQTRGAFDYSIIDKIKMNDEKISSTKIRELLHSGQVDKAKRLLDHPFSTTGMVVEGNKRGRELGYPTANLKINKNTLLPQPGIYAVRVLYKGEKYEGMASLGTNPTFSKYHVLSLEVNILDYNNDLYGEMLRIEWVKHLRGEVKFDNVDLLIEQMKEDEKQARILLKT